MRLLDKVAIVTGGASGIGAEACRTFAREGAKVAIADLNETLGEQTAKAIRAAGGEAFFVRVDVSSEADVQRMVRETVDRYGRIDVLYNNAAWYTVETATEIPLDTWRRTIDICLTGPFLCCKYVIPEMIKAGGGSIINTSSVGGTVAFDEHPAYNAAKGGLNLLAKNLAIDYGKYQIRVNCISPGIIETPLTKDNLAANREELLERCFTGRIGQPSDIAAAALFLASDESTFVTGSVMFVDNGWTAR